MIDKTGTVKIIDFGSVKVAGVVEASPPTPTTTISWAPPNTPRRNISSAKGHDAVRPVLARRHHLPDADGQTALWGAGREGQNQVPGQQAAIPLGARRQPRDPGLDRRRAPKRPCIPIRASATRACRNTCSIFAIPTRTISAPPYPASRTQSLAVLEMHDGDPGLHRRGLARLPARASLDESIAMGCRAGPAHEIVRRPGSGSAIGTRPGFRLSSVRSQPEIMTMLAPAPASPEYRRHVQVSAGPDRCASEATLHRLRPLSGHPASGLPPRQGGPQRRAGLRRCRAQGRRCKDDTIFRIYSMTKPITSVAFMMLVEEGRVALDEPVHKYIPEWKNLGVFVAGTAPAFLTRPPARPMLIVDLLRHTSGLTYGFQQRTNVDAAYREKKIGEVDKAGTLQIDDRGAGQNAAGVLAGRGLELLGLDRRDRLSRRQDLRPAVRAVPEAAHLRSARHDRHRLSTCRPTRRTASPPAIRPTRRRHELPRGRRARAADAAGRSDHELLPAPPSFISGGGGLCSTAADYLTFCRVLLNGGELGGVRLLGPKTLQLMTIEPSARRTSICRSCRARCSREATYNGIGFGLGFSVTMDPAQDPDSRQPRRICLGRRGHDLVLDRSGRGADRHLHDPGAAVERLSDPPRTAQPWSTRRSRKAISSEQSASRRWPAEPAKLADVRRFTCVRTHRCACPRDRRRAIRVPAHRAR